MLKLAAAFLDRDGVINHDSPNYILSPDDWQPIAGSLEAIVRLNQAGIKVVLISNQSAVARQYISQEMLDRIHQKMCDALAAIGGHLDAAYYCTHGPDDNCPCRKPKAGMILQALHELNIQHPEQNCLFFGDSVRDIAAAKAAQMPAILLRSGYKDADEVFAEASKIQTPLRNEPDLSTAIDTLLKASAC